MLKVARWKGEKNKIRVVFKLQFHASQVNSLGWEIMMVSLVPLDVGKATMKTDKVLVIGGHCHWRSPIYETVKLFQDPNTGKIEHKLYKFVVSANGIAAAATVGEVTVNLADYFEAAKPTSVSLPLKPSKSGIILHVTIQRMHADLEVRRSEEVKDTILTEQWTVGTHESYICKEERGTKALTNDDSIENGSPGSNTAKNKLTSKRTSAVSTEGSTKPKKNVTRENESARKNAIDDSITSSSLTKDNVNLPKEKTILDYLLMEYSDQRESQNRCFCSSVPDATTADASAQYEKYTISVKSQTEQLELSDLELENLITMESNRGEILLRKMNCLKGEKDALKRECEELKASQRKTDSNMLSLSVVEEIKQELQHERSLNANLRLQLHKTQEANSELILAVQDLEQLLEQKNTQIACPNCTKISIKQPIQDISEMNFAEGNSNVHVSECEELFETTSDGDDEQYQLDVLVNRDDKVDSNLKNNIDVYKVHQQDLQMQMEKLALKYEILKQENADLYSKLEQAQQEEIINQQRDCSDHSATISDLEEQIKVLKSELQERSRAYDASLEVITNENFKQQKRAKEAEDALWMTRLHNAKITERLQEEFEILAREITSTFHMNEKLAIQALAEANEIHLQKFHLEEQLEQNKADIAVLQERHEVEVKELSDLVDLKTKETESLRKKSEASDNQNKMGEAKIKALTENIFTLKTEVQKLSSEKVQLCEQIAVNKKSITEIEQLKDFSAEIEKRLYERNLESEVLKSELDSMREEADKLEKSIYKLQQLVEEKEMLIKSLNSEIEVIKERSKTLSLDEENEKENLLKQISHLQSDLRRKDDTTTILEKKLQEKITRSANSGVSMKTGSSRNKKKKPGSATQGSSEVTVQYEKIKLLEEKLQLKDAELENTMTSFLKREKHLNHRIEELERDLLRCDKEGEQNIKHNLDGDSAISIDNELVSSHKITSLEEKEEDSKSNKCNQYNLAEMSIQEQQNFKHNQDGDCDISIDNELTLSHEDISLEEKEQDSKSNKRSQYNLTEILHEMAMLRENNMSTEAELKEMQQRYTEISLRFAEVEGERQQLVMTVRNLKNVQKI